MLTCTESARPGWDTRRITRANSIRQPYTEQILRRLKTRQDRKVALLNRQRVYINASLKPGEWHDFQLLDYVPQDRPTDVLVGSVEVVGCEPDAREGGFAYRLAKPRRLSKPVKPDNHPQQIWFRPFGDHR